MDAGFKIIVHEISVDLSKADISDLFLKYGDVITVYINERNVYEGKKSGYVVFGNKRECCRAIVELNDQPPLYLSLQSTFSIEESTDVHFQTRHDDGNPLEPQANDLGGNCFNGSISLDMQSKNVHPDTVISKFQFGNCDRIVKEKRKEGNERIKPSKNSSALHLTPRQACDKTERIFEKERLSGKLSLAQCRRSYGNKVYRENVSKSIELNEKFSNEGIHCVKNNAFIPDKRIEGKCMQNTSETKKTDEVNATQETLMAGGNIVTEEMNIGTAEEKVIDALTVPKSSQEKLTAEVIIGSTFSMDINKQGMKSKYNGSSKNQSIPWDLLSDNPNTHIVNYDLCTQQKKLLTDKFTQVKVYHRVIPGEYWVHCINDFEDLRSITKLMLTKKISGGPYKPSVGEYCSVKLEKANFRCKVFSLEESTAKVQLIDFGILIPCEAANLSELPSLVKGYYAQAIHVKLDPWTPEKYFSLEKGDTFNVKAVEVVDEITKVQVDGVLYSEIHTFPDSFLSTKPATNIDDDNRLAENVNKIQWPPSVLNLLKVGKEAPCSVLGIHMNEDEQKDEIILAVKFDGISKYIEDLSVNFPKHCMELPEDPSFRPAVGELIAAYYAERDLWVRAILLSQGLNCWLVACCDLGVVLEVAKIQKIPTNENYAMIPCLAAKCNVIMSWLPRDDFFSGEWIKENSLVWVEVRSKENKHLECKLGLIKKSPLCVVSMDVWFPQMDKPLNCKISVKANNLECVHLSSGANVRVVSHFLSLLLYVQPWDEKSRQLIESLQENINNLVGKSEPIKEVPKVGKMYICYFSGDMKNYRAVVTKVKDAEHISVTYIDFGNDEDVRLSSLYYIPPELEKIPCFGVKIGLKRNFEKLLNKDALTFLSYLISDNVELMLNFPDGNLRSSELLMKDGSLVNDILKRLVDPLPERK